MIQKTRNKFIGGIIVPLLLSLVTTPAKSQGPGLLISEVLPNPGGTDSPFEYIELVATRNIDFSITPYSVVVCNNGNATVNGWVHGAAITYGFSITTGSVSQGDVVYVGGSSMAPTGTKIRTIDTGTQPGDGFGNAASGGVVGNGGGNGDGVAVFNLNIASITSSSVPIDAIFYGTGTGGAVVNGGADGYQLPINDNYNGGKLQAGSFLGPDAGGDDIITATGTFDLTSQTFSINRTWTINTAMTDGTTSISFVTSPPVSLSFATTHQTVNENAGTATVNINISSSNANPTSVDISVSAVSTANTTSDVTISNSTITFPGNSSGSMPFTFTINDDTEEEQTEYFVFEFTNFVNGQGTGTTRHYFYIKDNDRLAPIANNELSMQVLSSYQNGTEGSNSAEIVSHDIASQRLFVANSIANQLDILDFSNPNSITSITSIDLTPYGEINSVAVLNGIVALALQNNTTNPQDNGTVAFFDINGNFVSAVTVGAMPDMLTFNHAGNKILVACEGEPNDSYTNDPEGTIGVIDISGGVPTLNQSNVTIIDFTSFNGQENALRTQGIRIYGPGASAAMDFEPEYITVSDDDMTAWVSLQENNALAKIDLQTNTVSQLMPLGYKDHSLLGNGMDVSDQTNTINIANFPVHGMYQPDAITHITINGVDYVLTANEGDSRDYSGFSEESRISGLNLDAIAFPNAAVVKANLLSGRLNSTTATGDTDNDGDIDEIYTYGTRSFSIWNGSTGTQVYDSGDDFEMYTSNNPTYATIFNASNGGSATPKNRSDDKGPEPEGVATAWINGHAYAFISLERIGGLMTYNIDDPNNPFFVSYFNNRDFATNGPDRGAEGIIFIPAADSPNGNDLILLANEISSSLTIYQVNSCQALSNILITPTDSLGFCQGGMATLTTTTQPNVSYQWMNNNIPIGGETASNLVVNSPGNYALAFNNSTNQCNATTTTVEVTVAPLPIVVANVTSTSICVGESVTFTGSGALTYTWNNAVVNNVPYTPSSTFPYTVTGTDANNCVNTDQVTVVVNNLPNIVANATATTICSGELLTLSGSGAANYTWDNSVIDGVGFNATSTLTYTVTGTDNNNCVNTDQITVNVNPLPTITANATLTSICEGDQITLTGSGGQSYTWDNGVVNGISFIPFNTTTYTVTGTDNNNCTNTDQITVTVNPLPSPIITLGTGVIQTGTFSSYQWYLNGNLISGATSQTYDPLVDGFYSVVVTDANGCENESQDFFFTSTDLEEIGFPNMVSISPNPFIGNTTINLELPLDGQLIMEVYDAVGKKISTLENKELPQGKFTYQFSATDLGYPVGVYILKLNFNNRIASYRLVEVR